MAKWIAHRGESYDAPENTLASFRLSLERQTDGMECDIRLSADGKVIVSHDADTGRMGDKKISVEKSTFEELQQVCIAGAFAKIYPDEKIPLFADTLQYLGDNREFYVELKGDNPDLIPKAIEIIKTAGLTPAQIVFISFSRELIKLAKAAMPEYRALLLDGLVRDGKVVTAQELIRDLDDLGVDGIDCCDHPDIDAELVDSLHKAGKIFAVWTVNNPFRAHKLAAIGIDAITSDRAALLKNW